MLELTFQFRFFAQKKRRKEFGYVGMPVQLKKIVPTQRG